MRFPTAILVLVSLASFAAPLEAGEFVKATVRRPGGTIVAVAPLTTPQGNFPLCVVRTTQNRYRLVGYGLDGVQFYSGVLSAEPLGMRNIGGTVFLAQRIGNTVSVLQIRWLRGAVAPTVYGSEELAGLQGAKFLRITARGSRPALVFAHDRGILVVTPGKYRNRIQPERTHRYLACSGRFDADKDNRDDMALLTTGGRIVRLAAPDRTGTLDRSQDFPYMSKGVAVTTIAATKGHMWLGGSRAGRAAVLLFDADPPPPRIRKLKDIFKDPGRTGRAPIKEYELGRGAIEGLEPVGARHLVATGTRAGRAWAALLWRQGRVMVEDESTLTGSRVTAYCVNDKRIGWTVAVGTDDGALHVLRAIKDRAATHRSPAGGGRLPEEPVPDPRPDPRPDPKTTGTGGGGGGRTQPQATAAYFPRIEADTRRGMDTVLYLLYVGARPARVQVRYYDGTGRLVAQEAVTARRNSRVKISLAGALRKARVMDLDGWAVVTGCDKRDLIAEGLLYRGTANPESLRPFWR